MTVHFMAPAPARLILHPPWPRLIASSPVCLFGDHWCEGAAEPLPGRRQDVDTGRCRST